MKRIFIVLILFIAQHSNAQKYRAFDTTVTWHTIRSGWGSTMNCFSDNSYNYYTKGYEINNGLYWHKVYANIISGYYTGPTSSCPSPAPVASNTFVGYYYNDTLNKKVYFVPSGSLTPNFVPSNSNILFDFLNRNVSDVFNIGPGLGYQINSIDSVLFSGKYHKTYNCTTTFSVNYSPTFAYVIEGIGSSVGVFNPDWNINSQKSTPLLCFSNANNTKYLVGAARTQNWPKAIRDTSTCAWIVTGARQYPNTAQNIVNIYPNPTNEFLMLDLSSEADIKSVLIYNSTGQLIKQKEIIYKAEKTALRTNDLPNGVYLLQLLNADTSNKSTITRFIIAR